MRHVDRRRAVLGVVLLAALLGWLLWPSSSPSRPAPSPSAPVEVAVTALPAEAAPPRAPELVPAPVDAGVVTADAGSKPYSAIEVRLDRNNAVPPQHPIADNEWQRACRREAQVCAERHPLWLDAPPNLFDLETTEFESHVTGPSSVFGPADSDFMRCFSAALKLLKLPRMEDQKYVTCMLDDFHTVLNDEAEVSARLAACLSPNAQTRSVKASWDLVVKESTVEVENVEYKFEGPIDTRAEACVRRAVSTSSVRFSAKPPFTRERFSVRVITRHGYFSPHTDNGFPEVEGLPPLTDEQRARGDALVEEIQAAQREGDTQTVVSRAYACIQALPLYPTCYRHFGSASAKLVGGGPENSFHHTNAVAGYKRFVELASEEDPYRAKVQALLAEVGE